MYILNMVITGCLKAKTALHKEKRLSVNPADRTNKIDYFTLMANYLLHFIRFFCKVSIDLNLDQQKIIVLQFNIIKYIRRHHNSDMAFRKHE